MAISIHLEIYPLKQNLSYLLIYKFDGIPLLNSSIYQIDGWTLLCPSNLTNESIYTYFFDNQQTFGHQSVIIGLRELNSTEMIDFCSNSSLIHPPITNEKYQFTSNYKLRIYTSGCYYLDENNQWASDGLIVGPLTNLNQTQCFSKHLTTFAGGFVILPEPINWQYVFTNANFIRNKTIYLTIIIIAIIFLILIIYAKYKDRKDLEKLEITPLADNHRADEYFYQIIVFTGHRKYSGTKSNVHFILYGMDDQTFVRTLNKPHREIFQRGGIDSFVMSVPKSLGLLNCIRIWHDNTGQGSSSSWFLKYLIIRDLQTMEKFYFISQRWFAVEKDDGKIERVLSVANIMEKNQFSFMLAKKSYHSVSDGHLWFSIFLCPPSNKFTRVQRCTCCFVLLYVSMFLNIMYYNLQKEAQINNNSIVLFGLIRISTQQIIIGITVELLSLIPSMLIVQLFRRLRPHHTFISPLCTLLHRIKPSLKIENMTKKKMKKSLTFPWWFIFIAYSLSVLLVGVSIFFIIVRGIEFGDIKVQQWLISIVSGFFSSVLLTQPIKILSLAIFFACVCRKSHVDEQEIEYLDENELNLDNNEEYLRSHKNNYLFIYRPRVPRNRLNQAEIAAALRRRLKEIDMQSILREIFTCFAFLTILFIVTYSNLNQHSFLQVAHLRKYFLNSRQNDSDYTKISTKSDYWKWLETSFVQNIRAQQWYNGDDPRNLSGFINDKTNRLIGWITMRQLRVKGDVCSVKTLNFTCKYDYNTKNEETKSFEPGWKNQTMIKPNSIIEQAFQYQSQYELDTYIIQGNYQKYNGGGYVYQFRGRLSFIQKNLSKLHQLEWIDDRTRAIIIQLNMYNPNVQLFTSITLLSEFLSSGAIVTDSNIQPIQFYTFITSWIQFIYLFIFMIFISYLMFKEIQLFIRLKKKYFLQFWSILQLGIIICSWLSIGLYIWRYRECARIAKLFSKTNGYVYINLQLLTYINELLTFIYGFCCFFGTIKILHLFRFNSRIYIFIHTVQYAAKELIFFSIIFLLVFFSFNCLFYLLFMSKLWSCSTFYQTSEMLFEMILMKFDANQLSEAATFLGPFCFSLFILFVVFICVSVFLSIINRSFRQTRDKIEMNHQIYSFMLDRFLRWIRLKKQSKAEMYEEQDALMREQYFDPIEHFPEKIDQLFGAINRIYMDQ